MERLERALLAANRWALIALLAAMTLIIFTNVALRYLTHESIEWAEEVARQDALPRAFAVALRIVVALLLGGFFGFMVWYGVLYMQRTQFQTTAATQISFAYVYAAMPVGGGLLLVHWLLIVRGFVRGRVFAVDADFDAQAAASL